MLVELKNEERKEQNCKKNLRMTKYMTGLIVQLCTDHNSLPQHEHSKTHFPFHFEFNGSETKQLMVILQLWLTGRAIIGEIRP